MISKFAMVAFFGLTALVGFGIAIPTVLIAVAAAIAAIALVAGQ